MAGCSDSNDGAYANLKSNTECTTRGAVSLIPKRTLKMTYDGQRIDCELNNVEVSCSFSYVKVDCKQEGKRLTIFVDDVIETSGIISTCSCPINIYFSINEFEGNEFDLWIQEGDLEVYRYELGIVSFNGHRTAEIDLITKEIVYSD